MLLALCGAAPGQSLPAQPLAAHTRASQNSSTFLGWIIGDGLRLRVHDLEARVRTRLHMDLVEAQLDDVGTMLQREFPDSTDLRRARWLADVRFAKGSALEDVRVRGQVDFASSLIDWKDLFLRYDDAPRFGHLETSNLRVGQFRQPMGLEAMSSVSHIAFIERSTASNAFTPGRGRGAQWAGSTAHWLFQVGAFRSSEGLPFPSELGTSSAVTARALHQREGKGLKQIGGGVSIQDPGEDGARLAARPGTRLLPRVVDTGVFEADRLAVGSFEALWIGAGWAAVAEWFHATGSGVGAGGATTRFTGGHLSFQTFLHGGEVTWNRSRGGLRAARVPDAWTTRAHGNGAVELASRLSWVDLDDGPVRGGRSLDVELGLNWYLQPATRFMLHWVGTRVDGPDGDQQHGSAILARLQVQL